MSKDQEFANREINFVSYSFLNYFHEIFLDITVEEINTEVHLEYKDWK